MVKLARNSPGHNELFLQYPIVFGIKNYSYFMTYEEYDDIPFVNSQPAFDANSQYLTIETFEEDDTLKRRWVVTDTEPEDTVQNILNQEILLNDEEI